MIIPRKEEDRSERRVAESFTEGLCPKTRGPLGTLGQGLSYMSGVAELQGGKDAE